MKISTFGIGALSLIVAGAAAAQSDHPSNNDRTLVVTASNTTYNQLLVYNPDGTLRKTIPTRGQGGVSGNAGGIAQNHDRLAVVNFQSHNVSVFLKDAENADLQLERVIPLTASPVSVALDKDHLYILTTTKVESHAIREDGVGVGADGVAALLIADGSAAQVGILPSHLIFTEKSNAIESVNLDNRGAVAGKASLVSNIPTNVNAPFGLVTRGDDAYVTIADANEISLVRNDKVLTVTSSGTQMAPCWVALDGPFLFSANSPSHSVSRYAVYGQRIVQGAEIAATFNGDPTDIAYSGGLASVVDSNGNLSHLSIFHVDKDGDLNLQGVATISNSATNGVAIVELDRRFDH
jgi:hypothetical protein